MSNKTQSRFTYLSKRINSPSIQVPLGNAPDLMMTPLRKKAIGVDPKMIQLVHIPSRQDFYPENIDNLNENELSPSKGARCGCLDCYEERMAKRKVAMMKSPTRTLSPRKVDLEFEKEAKKSPQKDKQGSSSIYNRLMKRAITDKDLLSQIKKTQEAEQMMGRSKSRGS